MSSEIRLGDGTFGCSVNAVHGARLSSLRSGARERLVTFTKHAPATSWGAFPMVPFAGRVRHGTFEHDAVSHHLPRNSGPHSIHGTVFDTSWTIVERSPFHVHFVTPLGKHWPFAGSVTHEVSIDRAERSITCILTVSTTSASMPAQVGWHPWFLRPATLDFDFANMYVRDTEHIPEGRLVTPPPGPYDDCFTGSRRHPSVRFDDGSRIILESDCDHWVVYDMPKHAICLEPQSGPPNGFTLAPHVITPSSPLQRTLKLIAR